MSTSPSSSASFGGSCRFACQVLPCVSGRLRFLPRRHDCSCATTECASVDGDGDEDEDEDEDEDAHEHMEGLEHERHSIGAELMGK